MCFEWRVVSFLSFPIESLHAMSHPHPHYKLLLFSYNTDRRASCHIVPTPLLTCLCYASLKFG
jgi:hypothetical protein